MARPKISSSAFESVNDLAVRNYFEQINAEHQRIFGLRLLGVDGSSIRLEEQAYIDMISSFSELNLDIEKCRKSDQAPMARCSLIYDCFNEIAVDAQLKPTIFSELESLTLQLKKVSSQDLLVLDRGYHCYWLMALLIKLDIKFVIRAQTHTVPIKKFLKTGKSEQMLNLPKPANLTTTERHRALVENEELNAYKELNLRAVRYEATNENNEQVTYALLTNLTDGKKYPQEEFSKIYKARWRAEEAFKTYKVSIEIERWSGTSWHAAKQDFTAAILLTNLTRIFSSGVDKKIQENSQKRQENGEIRYTEKLNITEAARSFRTFLRSLATEVKFNCRKYLEGFCESIKEYALPIRPNRSFPHIRKNNKSRFNMNCKPSY